MFRRPGRLGNCSWNCPLRLFRLAVLLRQNRGRANPRFHRRLGNRRPRRQRRRREQCILCHGSIRRLGHWDSFINFGPGAENPKLSGQIRGWRLLFWQSDPFRDASPERWGFRKNRHLIRQVKRCCAAGQRLGLPGFCGRWRSGGRWDNRLRNELLFLGPKE